MIVAVLLVMIVAQADTVAQVKTIASEIPLAGDYRGVWTVPLDGSPGDDLLILTWSRSAGRTLAVHSQHEDGSFSSRPDRRIPVKSDIVAFSVADVRDDPGHELLLFTRSSCFSYSTTREGYADNARKELQWNLVCDMPDNDQLPFLTCAVDMNTGSPRAAPAVELMLPGRTGYGIFQRAKPAGPFRLIHETRLDGVSQERQRDAHGFTVTVSMSSSSRGRSFERLVMRPPTDPAAGESSRSSLPGGGETLLRTARWLPATIPADWNGDGLLDLCTIAGADDEAHLEVYIQGTSGFSAKPSSTFPVPMEGSLRLVDFDDDGDLDLLEQRNDQDQARLLFYRNDNGQLDTSKPGQLLKYSGYRVEPRFLDLDGDGNAELVVKCFDIPSSAAFGELAFQRRLFIHRKDPSKIFARRAAVKDIRNLTADGIDGLLGGNLDGDLDGDGIRDVVDIGDDGEVLVRRISKDLRISTKPFWSHRPGMMIRELWVKDLDGDGRSDVLLRHARSLKVLVMR